MTLLTVLSKGICITCNPWKPPKPMLSKPKPLLPRPRNPNYSRIDQFQVTCHCDVNELQYFQLSMEFALAKKLLLRLCKCEAIIEATRFLSAGILFRIILSFSSNYGVILTHSSPFTLLDLSFSTNKILNY